ncbi:hypothetical protein [Aureimonas sp. D3]|uniref:hypothetical protein n=1 Tax=Aureimonas sp. D3 TaxID=1638164 RepID=UPI001AEC6AC6|nr:hypothetical protein [Aureimonas sp. D3]
MRDTCIQIAFAALFLLMAPEKIIILISDISFPIAFKILPNVIHTNAVNLNTGESCLGYRYALLSLISLICVIFNMRYLLKVFRFSMKHGSDLKLSKSETEKLPSMIGGVALFGLAFFTHFGDIRMETIHGYGKYHIIFGTRFVILEMSIIYIVLGVGLGLPVFIISNLLPEKFKKLAV